MYLRIVVLVHPRLERARTNGILRAKAETQRDGLARSKGIEVKDRLGGCKTELFQATALKSFALLQVCLQVLIQQLKSRRDSQIDHDHVCVFIQIVLDYRRGIGDVVL